MEDKNYLQLLRRAVQRESRKLPKLQKAVSEGDVEGIHDFRVALRRIRSALRLIEGDSDAKKIRKRAKDFASAVGAARDLDVLIQRKGLPDAWVLTLRLERESALAMAAQTLEGKQFRKWRRRLKAWLADDKADTPAIPYDLKSTVKSQAEAVLQLKDANNDEALHQLRISVKRLRYTMEFFKGDLSPDLKRSIPRLAKVQDELGVYNDVGVAMGKLATAIELAEDLEMAGDLATYHEKLMKQKERMRPERSAAKAIKLAEAIDASA